MQVAAGFIVSIIFLLLAVSEGARIKIPLNSGEEATAEVNKINKELCLPRDVSMKAREKLQASKSELAQLKGRVEDTCNMKIKIPPHQNDYIPQKSNGDLGRCYTHSRKEDFSLLEKGFTPVSNYMRNFIVDDNIYV